MKPGPDKLEAHYRTSSKEEGWRMASLRHIHQIMNARGLVLLADGRTAKILRVDTLFPDHEVKLTVWTSDRARPSLAKVERIELKDVVVDPR